MGELLPKKTKAAFKKTLRRALEGGDVEKAVEGAYAALVEDYFSRRYQGVSYSYPHNTDGVLEVPETLITPSFSVLVETKRGLDYSARGPRKGVDLATTLTQVIFYLKRFQEAGESIPNGVIIGDEDEILTVNSKFLTPYLLSPLVKDWSVAPSKAAETYPELVEALKSDNNIRPHIENILEDSFDAEAFLERTNDYALDVENHRKIRVDKEVLAKAFLEFQRVVFGGQAVNTQAQMMLFVKSLLGDDTIWLHPRRKNVIVTEFKDHKGKVVYKEFPPSNKFVFDAEAYDRYWNKYDRGNYSLAERKEITEISDQLFEDFERRFHGDFWTPKIWVDEAHRLIERQLNEYVTDDEGRVLDRFGEVAEVSGREPAVLVDWKDKYVVWDPACGSLNLTRDYKFKELYASTLHQDELNIAEDYNPEATKFQYDFLNDDIELHEVLGTHGSEGLFNVEQVLAGRDWKLPDGLITALRENKPIVFFANPPYGQASAGMKDDGTSTTMKGISSTKTGNKMQGFGRASAELYAQFIYRVQLLARSFNYSNDFHFFFFFNKGFLTSTSFRAFVDQLRKDFAFKDGFMLNAGEFSGTSSAWGIIFSHWSLSFDKKSQEQFNFDVLKSFPAENRLSSFGKWRARLTTKQNTMTSWLRNIPLSNPVTEFPRTKNGFDPSSATQFKRMTHQSFGYFYNHASINVQTSDKYTGLYSFGFATPHGTPVEPANFEEASVVFAVRKSVLEQVRDADLLWVRDKDIFTKPSQEFQDSEEWDEFVADSVVYSLFASGSNQTSLRDYEYGENSDGTPRKWRINNEFFWESKEFIQTLAEESKNLEVEKDLIGEEERFVYSWIEDHADDLSEEARKVLKLSRKLLKASFKYRQEHAKLYPRYQLNTWDAGFLQLYRLSSPRSRDALPAAKNDPELVRLWGKFEKAVRKLGDKIADRYQADTGF